MNELTQQYCFTELNSNIAISDSHCHLSLILEQFPLFLEVLEDISSTYNIQLIDVGLDPNDWHERSQQFNKFSNIYKSVGLHPCNYGKYTPQLLNDTLLPLASQAKAIGETGLDWYRMYAPKKQQIELFEVQINIAKQLQLPLIIHARDAIDDILEIIQYSHLHSYSNVVGVMHCFSGNKTQAKKCIDLGLMISFAANISYNSAIETKEAVATIPDDFLLAETDSPYILHKQTQKLISQNKKTAIINKKQIKRVNTPLHLSFLYETIAHERSSTIEQIAKLVTSNFYRLISHETRI